MELLIANEIWTLWARIARSGLDLEGTRYLLGALRNVSPLKWRVYPRAKSDCPISFNAGTVSGLSHLISLDIRNYRNPLSFRLLG